MDICISHGTVKRRIEGPFEAMFHRKDAEDIVEILRGKLKDESWGGGWIQINNLQRSLIVPPKDWEEE